MFARRFVKSAPNACGRAGLLWVAVSCLLCFAGCGGESGPQMEPVSGMVTLKDEPIEGVEVYFVHEQKVTIGKTDNEGYYELVPGAVAGENQVYFSKIVGGAEGGEDDGMAEFEMEAAQANGVRNSKVPKQVIPAEYSNSVKPKLNFTVPSGGSTTADFNL